MNPIIKSLLALFMIAALQHHAFSQAQRPVDLYVAGESLANKNRDKAYTLFTDAMNLARAKKDWDIYIKSINRLASITYRDDEKKQLQVFESLKLAVKILNDVKKTDDLARLYFNAGKFYIDLTSEVEPSMNNFEKAKNIWSALKGKESKEVADCYHELGDIYKYITFDFQAAEKMYEMALRTREKINFNDPIVLYRNYYSLAATNRSQRDFEKALSYANRATEIVQKLEPHRQEQCAAMIANVYRDMGNLELAKKYYQRALKLNALTDDLDNRAWYYLCLGETFKYDSLPNQALNYFRKAYDLYTTPGVKDQALFVNLLISVIDIFASTAERNNSSGFQARAISNNYFRFEKVVDEIFDELRASDMLRSTEAAYVWLVLGKHHTAKMRYDSALFCYQKALIASVPSFESLNVLDNPTEQMIGFQYYVNEILSQKALALKKAFEGNDQREYLTKSLACLVLAERLVSRQRNTLDMDDSKWLFLEQNFDLYEKIIEILYDKRVSLPQDSVNLLAFQYFESSKARSLADALALTERNKQISIEDSLLRAHSDLKRKLFSAQEQINRGLEKSVGQSEMSDFRNKVVEIDQQIQAVKLVIEQKYPGYFNVMYGYQTAMLPQVQEIVKLRDQVLLEYFWGRHSVYGLCLSGEKIILQRLGEPDTIKYLINQVLSSLSEQHGSTSLSRYKEYSTNAYQLHEILIKPFAEFFEDNKRIQIIPDGSINQLPFEALLEEKPQINVVDYRSLKYLIKSFTIGYAYSSSMLTHRSRAANTNPSMLVMGYKGRRNVGASAVVLSEIKGAEEELLALKKRFQSGKFLLGTDANEANFKMFAPEFDIIHLAVHGTGNMEKNFASSLYFSEAVKNEDGELHAYELYGLKLKALMAVLSSCESGLGKGYRGEGMISMASAFTYSGCQNILMSLWKVNDQVSIRLMDEFYGNLLGGATIDGALRQTKLKYLENADELSADPKIWAPLVAYGSLDKVFSKDRSNIVLYLSGAFILALLLLSFNKLRKWRLKN